MKWLNKLINKCLNRGLKRSYTIQEQNGKYIVCKVLVKYNTEDEAIHAIAQLINNNTNEYLIRQDI